MNLPNIFELLALLDGWRGYPAVGAALVTAVVVAAAWDWRLSILALMAHYLFAGLLFVELLDPRLAAVKVLVGLFVCLILYFTARQVNWGRPPPDVTPQEAAQLAPPRVLRLRGTAVVLTAPLRLGGGLLLALLVFLLARLVYLPGLPAGLPFVNVAVVGLLLLGVVGMALAREPLQGGMGLLIFLSGFEMFYHSANPAAAALAALAVVNFGVALVISYLTQARFAVSTLIED